MRIPPARKQAQLAKLGFHRRPVSRLGKSPKHRLGRTLSEDGDSAERVANLNIKAIESAVNELADDVPIRIGEAETGGIVDHQRAAAGQCQYLLGGDREAGWRPGAQLGLI